VCTGLTLILHWNGSTWTRVNSPSPSHSRSQRYGNYLTGVSALSPTDAWITGHYGPNGVALQWNGSAWARVASAGITDAPGHLYGVSADSATDAWAVGQGGSGPTGPLIAHWNGSTWSKVAGPDPGYSPELLGVSAVSPSSAWAVGDYGGYDAEQAVLLQWNGSAWTQAATLTPKGWVTGDLSGVSADSATDAWAVGDYSTAKDVYSFILHWNGTAWTKVTSPSP
jgi:hypothetical protein